MSGQAALTEFLRVATGKPCLVVLSTESEIHGTLCTIDGLFNLVLRDATEFVKGAPVSAFTSVYVRGNKVVHVAPLPA
jgi:U6 snRNA-associated Sm-like protein LSm6